MRDFKRWRRFEDVDCVDGALASGELRIEGLGIR